MSNPYDTRYTLIERATDLGDEAAWTELLTIYEPLIYHILKGFSLQHHDVQNIAQESLVKLTKNLGKYDASKGRFRNWVSMIVKREALMLIRRYQGAKERVNLSNGDDSLEKLRNVFESVDHEVLFDREWEKYLFKLAWERVKLSFSSNAQQCFELSIGGAPLEEIMEKTGLSKNSVAIFRSSIKRAMTHEVARLEERYDRG